MPTYGGDVGDHANLWVPTRDGSPQSDVLILFEAAFGGYQLRQVMPAQREHLWVRQQRKSKSPK